MNKKISEYNLPINTHTLNTKNKKHINNPIRLVKSSFYQTDKSVCRYPLKPNSKIIVLKKDEDI